MKTLIPLLFLIACATQNKTIRELYPKNKPKDSKIVLSAFEASGLAPLIKGQTRYFRGESVACLRDLNIELWKCSFLNSGKQYEIPSIESSALSGILMGLPVPQGDSGVATSFIECRMFDGNPDSADCDIAISLDYPGP